MKLINSSEMKKYDAKTITELGISSLILMERASLEVFYFIKKNYKKFIKKKEILILAGFGNNGADGIALARMLFLEKFNIRLVLIGDENKRTNENNIQIQIIEKLGIKKYSFEDIEKDIEKNEFEIIVDSIFGIGITRDLDKYYSDLIEKVNNMNGLKIALDIPTGINGDNGQIMKTAFKADYTFTFGFYKTGLFMDSSIDYVGKVILVDIGIPDFFADEVKTNYLTEEKILSLIKKRPKSSYKNMFGNVLIIGGSENMSGAIAISTKASLRSGVGLVNVLVEKNIHSIITHQVPSAMVNYYNDFEDFIIKFNSLSKPNSIAFGMGCGKNSDKKKILEFLILNFEGNLLIDADGLNLLSENMDLLKQRKFNTIITPHLGEFSRLVNKDKNEISKNKLDVLENFMEDKNNLVCVLKGGKSIISNGNEIYINSTGNPIFARGGSGDILSGLIAGLLAYNNPFDSALLGTYIHGLAGDLAINDFSEISILPEEIIDYISKAFFYLEKN